MKIKLPKKQMTIVVGAGAGVDVNMPLGEELKEKIATLLNIKFRNIDRQTFGDAIITRSIRHAIKE